RLIVVRLPHQIHRILITGLRRCEGEHCSGANQQESHGVIWRHYTSRASSFCPKISLTSLATSCNVQPSCNRLHAKVDAMSRLLVSVLFFSLPCLAQFPSAIQGPVTDSSGAAVPDAKVTLKNVDTGIVRTSLTSAEGLYRIPSLGPGTYS